MCKKLEAAIVHQCLLQFPQVLHHLKQREDKPRGGGGRREEQGVAQPHGAFHLFPAPHDRP